MAANTNSCLDEIQLIEELQLGKLLHNGNDSDVTFIVENEHITAHRTILAIRTEYFRALLYGGLKESKQQHITLNVPLRAFKCIMEYIYTGTLSLKELKNNEILDTLSLAHEYGLTDLHSAITDILCTAISIENACHKLDIALLLQSSSLVSVCCTFIDEQAERIASHESFLNLSFEALSCLLDRDTFNVPEIDIFRTVWQWYQLNTVERKTHKALLDKVRFSLISQKDLLDVVRTANVLKPDRLVNIMAEKRGLKELPYRRKMGNVNVDDIVSQYAIEVEKAFSMLVGGESVRCTDKTD